MGNIAPDCNVENDDGTSYTPSREITHWMSGKDKTVSNGDLFYEEYIRNRTGEIESEEQYAFLLGYYAHLITDAAFQNFVRDENRVKAAWKRIKTDEYWRERAKGYPEDWNSIRKMVPKNIRMNEIFTMEAEYLKEHPDSGYLTEIVPLKEFPDYIDYLPHGCIARKIRIMGRIPEVDENIGNPVTISWAEYDLFVNHAVELVLWKFGQTVKEDMEYGRFEIDCGMLD